MISAITTAVSGLSDIGERVNDRAERIARATSVNTPEPGEPLDPVMFKDQLVNDVVGLGLDATQFKANLAVINVAGDMEKQLLNMIA
jgi:hypothetical protein